MTEQDTSGGKLTLEELNRYLDDLKVWLENTRAIQTLQQQAFERELGVHGELQENDSLGIPCTLYHRYGREDPQKAMEMSTGLAVLEVVYRAIACAYETYWLHNDEPATPGKLLLGLRVVYVTDVVEVNQHNHFLYLYPASGPSFKVALCRAIVKNVLLGVVMFPMCFGMFISKYKRTFYDLLVGTIVVEHRGHLVQEVNDN